MGARVNTDDLLAKHQAGKAANAAEIAQNRPSSFAKAAARMAPRLAAPARDVVGDMCARLGVMDIANLAQLGARTGMSADDLLTLLNDVADQWAASGQTDDWEPGLVETGSRDDSWMMAYFDPDYLPSFAAALRPATRGLTGYRKLNGASHSPLTRMIGGRRYEIAHVLPDPAVA